MVRCREILGEMSDKVHVVKKLYSDSILRNSHFTSLFRMFLGLANICSIHILSIDFPCSSRPWLPFCLAAQRSHPFGKLWAGATLVVKCSCFVLGVNVP